MRTRSRPRRCPPRHPHHPPLSELARQVGLSPQSVRGRLKRLADIGVVAGYSVRLDRKALGLSVGAYIRVRPMIGELHRVARLLHEIPQIVECDRITGDDCFIAKTFVAPIEELEEASDRLIPYAQTNTSV